VVEKVVARLADGPGPERKKLVFLTGAGISAESGIRTFRASDGLWNGHRIEDVATPRGWEKAPANVLAFYNQRRAEVLAASPNAGHLACAELEMDFEVTVVTQNIDDLHERADSPRVFHLHGEILKGQSSKNSNLVFPLEGPIIRIGDKSPDGSQVRPHVVWFEEPVLRMKEATKAARDADVFVVCGTSLAVFPAAGLAQLPRPGTPLYLIDPNPPTLPDGNWTVIAEPASSGVQRLMRLLRGG
jgi:NAD-dependent deacetylase